MEIAKREAAPRDIPTRWVQSKVRLFWALTEPQGQDPEVGTAGHGGTQTFAAGVFPKLLAEQKGAQEGEKH